MIRSKKILVIGISASLLFASATWAGATSASLRQQGKLVTFTSETIVAINNGVRTGTFKISCTPISKAALGDTAWMTKCNALGAAAIEKEVALGLIQPVKGPAFVNPSSLKGALEEVDSLTFTRSLPLIKKEK